MDTSSGISVESFREIGVNLLRVEGTLCDGDDVRSSGLKVVTLCRVPGDFPLSICSDVETAVVKDKVGLFSEVRAIVVVSGPYEGEPA